MREYLFRGKNELDNWVYGNLIYAGDYCCILQKEEDVHPMDYPFLDPEIGWIDGKATPVISETVGQYTGLTDKNGTKIFEGDIVSVYGNGIPLFIEMTNLEKESEYASISWNCRMTGCPSYLHRLENKSSKYEIIGNVYDNPELLEVK